MSLEIHTYAGSLYPFLWFAAYDIFWRFCPSDIQEVQNLDEVKEKLE